MTPYEVRWWEYPIIAFLVVLGAAFWPAVIATAIWFRWDTPWWTILAAGPAFWAVLGFMWLTEAPGDGNRAR